MGEGAVSEQAEIEFLKSSNATVNGRRVELKIPSPWSGDGVDA
jgi:hypothetical protein